MKIRLIVAGLATIATLSCSENVQRFGKAYDDVSTLSVKPPPDAGNPVFQAYAPGYLNLWNSANVWSYSETLRQVDYIHRYKERYEYVESQTGVPWFVVGIISLLESGGSFTTHLHNGDPLSGRTYRVPAGRPVFGSPPFTWEESAVDAIRYEGLDLWNPADWFRPEVIAYALEAYNGFGYRTKGIHSPYLWSKTNHYTRGKYTYDGYYDPYAVSQQVGGMAILKVGIIEGFWSLDSKLDGPMVGDFCRLGQGDGVPVKLFKSPDPSSSGVIVRDGGRYKIVGSQYNGSWSQIQLSPPDRDSKNSLAKTFGSDFMAWVKSDDIQCDSYEVNSFCSAISMGGENIKVRAKGDPGSSIRTTLQEGARFEILSEKQHWAEVSFVVNGKEYGTDSSAWIYKGQVDCSDRLKQDDYLSCKSAAGSSRATFVRQNPNPTSSIIDELEDGVPLKIFGKKDKYYAVRSLDESLGVRGKGAAFVYGGQLICDEDPEEFFQFGGHIMQSKSR